MEFGIFEGSGALGVDVVVAVMRVGRSSGSKQQPSSQPASHFPCRAEAAFRLWQPPKRHTLREPRVADSRWR
jgi:hypothetical protein